MTEKNKIIVCLAHSKNWPFWFPLWGFIFVTKNGNQKGQHQVKWEPERTKSSKFLAKKTPCTVTPINHKTQQKKPLALTLQYFSTCISASQNMIYTTTWHNFILVEYHQGAQKVGRSETPLWNCLSFTQSLVKLSIKHKYFFVLFCFITFSLLS